MIDREFQQFIDRWLHKADVESDDALHTAFDKFYAQFLVYNKLYVEIFNILTHERPKRYREAEASSNYIVKFVGGSELWRQLEGQQNVKEAISNLENILVSQAFYITLDASTGNPKLEADKLLLSELRSASPDSKATSLLQILYRIRCNLVHGRKQFVPYQKIILDPSNIIIRKLINILMTKLLAA
jgi:hypothetical protein